MATSVSRTVRNHMWVDTLPIGPLLANCYLVTCSQTREAALIDPGWDTPAIMEAAAARGATVRYVLNTHAHFDHVAGNAAAIKRTGAKLALHHNDLSLLHQKGGADAWGLPMQPSPEPDILLTEGQILEIGGLRLEVLFTPGHTPGHLSFYERAHRALFDGDVLFRQGIGRTDLPGGSPGDLMRSIRQVLLNLPDEVVVYPGHGPATTIGEERHLNPWLV